MSDTIALMPLKLTTKQIDVLNRGLALAQLWIDEIPTFVEEDWDPGTFERWRKDHRDFSQLIKELSPDLPMNFDSVPDLTDFAANFFDGTNFREAWKNCSRTKMPDELMDRYYTEDEVRKMFLDAIRDEVSYWSKQEGRSEKERCDGLIHSVLCIIDGVSERFPSAITLMTEGDDSDLSECPDKKIRAGQTFNLHTMLHESYYNHN